MKGGIDGSSVDGDVDVDKGSLRGANDPKKNSPHIVLFPTRSNQNKQYESIANCFFFQLCTYKARQDRYTMHT